MRVGGPWRATDAHGLGNPQDVVHGDDRRPVQGRGVCVGPAPSEEGTGPVLRVGRASARPTEGHGVLTETRV
ncbi:hypothetical protein GCM10025788_05380 [Serinicoccus chungangensis]